jgi:hypothetical protein
LHLPDDNAAWRTRRRDYFHLLKTKHESFWRQQENNALGQPRVLWSAFTTLLGRGRATAADAIDAAVLHDFFDNKVAAMRDSKAGARTESTELIRWYFCCQRLYRDPSVA